MRIHQVRIVGNVARFIGGYDETVKRMHSRIVRVRHPGRSVFWTTVLLCMGDETVNHIIYKPYIVPTLDYDPQARIDWRRGFSDGCAFEPCAEPMNFMYRAGHEYGLADAIATYGEDYAP